MYILAYTFEAEDSAELSAIENSVVKVLRKCDKNGNPEWWKCENESGQTGYIPDSYLKKYNVVLDVHKDYLTRTTSDSCLPRQGEVATLDHKTVLGETSPKSSSLEEISKTLKPTIIKKQSSKKDSSSIGSMKMSDLLKREEDDSGDSYDETVQFYVMEYDFEALHTGELSLKEGQVAKVKRKVDQKGNSEWWLVEYEGKQGYVPQNYLKFVQEVPYL